MSSAQGSSAQGSSAHGAPTYVELRVHGVSGTSPESLLGVKDVGDPVAGDGQVRFYRRRSEPDPPGPDDDPDRLLEGMSWGRLTSGSVVQAAWLLLLPFSLSNLAYWARPWSGNGWLTSTYAWLLRLLGLSLTATIVFTAASASLDLTAWQCAIRDQDDCLHVNGWLDVTRDWGAGTTLAAATALPVLVVVGLAVLSHRTSLRYEAFHADDVLGTAGPVSTADVDPDLYSPDMWRGDVLVGRLRVVHTAVGLAVSAVILARAAVSLGGGWTDGLGGAALVVAAVVLLAGAWLVAPWAWVRWGAADSPRDALLRRQLVAGAVLALGLAVVAALSGSGRPEAPEGHLVGIIATGHVLVLLQVLLLGVLLGVSVLGRRRISPLEDVPGAETDDVVPSPALWGMAGWFIGTLSVLLGFAYSAAVVFRVSDLLTGEAHGGPCTSCATYSTAPEPAPAFEIAAFASGVFIVLLLVLGGAVALDVVRRRVMALRWVREEYPDAADVPDTDYRVQRAVRPRAFASAISLDRFRYIFLTACVVGIASGLYSAYDALFLAPGKLPEGYGPPDALARLFGEAPPERLDVAFDFLRDFGAWAVAGLAVALLGLGFLAWRSEKARRLVGIAWDVVSLWPRSGHPLAPPCYAERAVPQLACRLDHLVRADLATGVRREPAGPGTAPATTPLVLVGHSQGSVLAVAALAQLSGSRQVRDGVRLLTIGCPLMRLYRPVFPRVLGAAPLAELWVHPERWTNLWRRTDPIGSSLRPLLQPVPVDAAADVRYGDVRLTDPAGLQMDPTTSAYPPVHGHSTYWADPAYATWRGRLLEG